MLSEADTDLRLQQPSAWFTPICDTRSSLDLYELRRFNPPITIYPPALAQDRLTHRTLMKTITKQSRCAPTTLRLRLRLRYASVKHVH